jgi:hypothetical protein
VSEASLHFWLLVVVFVLAAVTALALVFVVAPYGRHARAGWGPTLPNRLGWILMESPAVVWFAYVYARGRHAEELVPLILLSLWMLHYVHRTFVFPFRLRTGGKRMPLLVMLLGMAFQGLNGWLNARWISHLGEYGPRWLADPRFVCGAAIFLLGWGINLRADAILIGLRRGVSGGGYRIPRGFLFRWVSSPNYLGELIEWCGWALLTWSGAGLAFAVYTAANLIPRAVSHHRWYRDTFPDYPAQRRAILPGLL